jgi:ketosteroid isomerase-like protein
MYKKALMRSVFVLVAAASGSFAAEPATSSTDVDDVTKAVMAFNHAYEVNDLEEYFSFYQDDATLWFNTDFVTIADYKEDWRKLIESGGSVEKNQVSDLRVVVSPGGDAAAAAYRLEVLTRMPDGTITHDLSQESDTWFKVDGNWKIAHLHYVSQPAP